MSTSLSRLAICISAHAWNGDRSRVALCPNNNEVHIYKRSGTDFEIETVLTEHDSLVTGIDWAPKTNRLLTCSQDRNAYVWTFEADGKWKPTLVILRITRAATCCQWSPKEDKFAVGSGAKLLSVCYFEPDNNWWVSKHIREKIDSTITCIDWHPNNILIAAAGTDGRARVVSGFVSGIDKKDDVKGGTAFGTKLPFGTLLAEFQVAAWIQAVKWSPSGNQLAWVSQDSRVHFLNCPTPDHQLQTVSCKYLPYRDLLWINENSVVCVGHDANPTHFIAAGAQWKLDRQLDTKQGGGAAKAVGAKDVWAQRTNLGAEGAGQDTKVETQHQNSVTVIRRLDNNTIVTTGIDGNIVLWPLAAVGLKA